jgi:bifunctional oligoribonuclease and PAP phosphatase NrnA
VSILACMSDKLKQFAAEALQLINQSRHVLLHCHPSPDPDSVGSVLAMAEALRHLGKQVTIIGGDSIVPKFAAFLPGGEQIINKNYFETDLSAFDLFIILDSGGLSQISKKGEIQFPPHLKTIVIDHHATNGGFGDLNLIDDSYPATAQMVFELFRIWEFEITADMALCLMSGLYSDTGGFKYGGTTEATFRAAAELAKVAPGFSNTIFLIENNREREGLIYEGMMLHSIETFYNNRVAIAGVSFEEMQEKRIERRHIEGVRIAEKLRTVIGWDIVASLAEKEPGRVGISLRTRDATKYDVSKVAAQLGGGGHRAASGAMLVMTLPEAKQEVIRAIGEVYPELK